MPHGHRPSDRAPPASPARSDRAQPTPVVSTPRTPGAFAPRRFGRRTHGRAPPASARQTAGSTDAGRRGFAAGRRALQSPRHSRPRLECHRRSPGHRRCPWTAGLEPQSIRRDGRARRAGAALQQASSSRPRNAAATRGCKAPGSSGRRRDPSWARARNQARSRARHAPKGRDARRPEAPTARDRGDAPRACTDRSKLRSRLRHGAGRATGRTR